MQRFDLPAMNHRPSDSISPEEAAAALAPWEDRRELAVCYDLRRTFLSVNTAFARKFGSRPDELVGHPIADYLHPEDFDDWDRETSRMEDDWKPLQREHRWKTAQGWRWLAWEESYVFGEDGYPTLVVAVARDVTRRRLAEEHFSKLAQVVEQSPVGILMTALDGTVQYVNPTYTETTGFTLEEIFDHDIRVLREGHTSDESFQELEDTVSSGRTWQGELCTRRKDGSVIWERVQVSPIRGAGGERSHLLCLREDITIEKNLEMQLQQAQKMESLGTLASGIAHDFNNILAIIRGFSELLDLRGGLDEASSGKVRKILEATNRASDLIRRILTFSRKGEVSFRPLDLNAQIEDLARLLRETFPRNIQLELNLDASLPRIPADAAQIQQVIMNLCVNARDAMKNGGALRLETTRICGSTLNHLQLDPSLHYLRLDIKDTGCGIPPEIAARIFEPFFTTKEKSGGTGLGLSVVYGIVNNHFGTIHLDSEPGRGTCFSVFLPIKDVVEGQATGETDEPFATGSERLAIVDDEAAIRDLLTVAFQSHGYQTRAYVNGKVVIDALNAGDFGFDAVVLDLDMPEMNGVQVLEALRLTRPELPVVVITGHLEAGIRKTLESSPNLDYILKPFHLNRLGAKTRRLLDASKVVPPVTEG